MQEIYIQNITPFQKMILDTIWQMETPEQVQAFRNSLPENQQQICDAMIYMLIAEIIDQNTTTEEDCEVARDLLDSY